MAEPSKNTHVSTGAGHVAPDDKAAHLPVGWIIGSVLLSAAVFAAVTHFTFDWEALRRFPWHVRPWLLAPALGSVVLRVFFGGYRLRYFSTGRLSLRACIRSQIAWDFFAYITPSTIGGGPLVSAFISRDQHLPLGDTTSIVLFSMLVDQIWFALTIPIVLFLTPFVEIIPESAGSVASWSFALFLIGFLGWVLFFGYITLISPEALEKLTDRIFRIPGLRRYRERVRVVSSDFRQRADILRTQPPSFYLRGLVITALPWLMRYVLILFVIWTVYPSANGLLVFLRAVALNLSVLALPTPGGAGGAEGLYVLFFGPLLPAALVAPTLLVWRLLSYYLFIVAGLIIMANRTRKSIQHKRQLKIGMAPSSAQEPQHAHE
ncbi:MAG TPA: lysylphosphatidylglycerol synthase transmembrane domain-containing protein [Rhodothermales bacterium]|nr:lysylphosphatidylglycerol synthase transmembrane domain-containing protein [Rhodothermales bacterium]